jgi:cobaltochelatase CobT
MSRLIERIRAWFSPPKLQARGLPYRVFTNAYDVEINADKLDSVIGPLSAIDSSSLEESWAIVSGAMQGWRTKAHLIALEASERIRAIVPAAVLSDTTVTILVDQSGSMRGQSMILAVAGIDVICDFLVHLGASVEVLGFTTVRWKGGKARETWLRAGRPPNPGRLCDLLHVIYRATDSVGSGTGGWSLRPMLRPDLPKENIDGEAIEWAASRLRRRPSPHKILLVVSDGAPVDDSTLLANNPHFLEDHLRAVIGEIEQLNEIRLAAIGIGFDVSRYYATSKTLVTAGDLGGATIRLIERVITENNVGWAGSLTASSGSA